MAVDAARKHLADILADFFFNELVQLGIHRQKEFAVLFLIYRQVVGLERVFLQIEEFDIIQSEDVFDLSGIIVLLRRIVTGELITAVEHTADGAAFPHIRTKLTGLGSGH